VGTSGGVISSILSAVKPISVGINGTYEGGAITTAATSRMAIVAAVACTNLQPRWQNHYDGTTGATDTDNATAVPINASIEYPAGTIYRLTFNGNETGTLYGGGKLDADPLAIELPAGAVFWVRTYYNATNVYWNRTLSANGAGGFTNSSDLTAPGSGAIADVTTGGHIFGPVCVLGIALKSSVPAVLIGGDSLGAGKCDGILALDACGLNTSYINTGGNGFIARALNAAGIPAINIAISGDTAALFALGANHFRRMVNMANCTSFIYQGGVNDISGGASLATIQANWITIWTRGSNAGLRVFQTIPTPETNSTDNWATIANQTVKNATTELVRVAAATWLRQGAPMLNGAATTYGTAGSVVAGQSGHPLTAVFDPCSVIEPAQNDGLWIPSVVNRTTADGTYASGGFGVSSATAAFVAASDNGRTLTLAGAGAAGALYIGQMWARASASLADVTPQLSTNVTGAALSIIDQTTFDGTHPAPYGAGLVAACVETSLLV
jgi:lysophospholipase L1-like esterase